jgi:hypothetical protein
VARQFCVVAMMLVAPSPSHHEEEQEADSTLSEVEETTDEPKTKRKSKVMKKILKAISFHVPILSSPLPPPRHSLPFPHVLTHSFFLIGKDVSLFSSR